MGREQPVIAQEVGLIDSIPHHELCYRVIGVAMRVHRDMPRGLREGEYQRGLWHALSLEGIEAKQEEPVPVSLDGAIVGLLRPDITVAPGIPVELKAVSHVMTRDELSQVIAYLAALSAPVGLYFNFGRPALEYRRILPPRQVTDPHSLFQRALNAQVSRRYRA
jgi:GxxExxY protein